jgi:hypothetical protein
MEQQMESEKKMFDDGKGTILLSLGPPAPNDTKK